MEVPCPRSRTTATVEISMVDKNGKFYRDEFAISFHMGSYRILKWTLAGPFLVTALAVIRAAPLLGHNFRGMLPT